MQKFTVYTLRSIYKGVEAYSAEHAKKVVWKQTFGREKPENMVAVREGGYAA